MTTCREILPSLLIRLHGVMLKTQEQSQLFCLNSDKSFLLKVMLHEEKQIELAQSEGVE
jgi:hypothetical protein